MEIVAEADLLHQHLAARFWPFVEAEEGATDPCWLWTGRFTSKGYAAVRLFGGSVLGHVVGYEVANGPVPEGLVLDHLCRVRHCVNPHHLEAVTAEENTRRGHEAKVTCAHGHAFDFTRSDGHRGCRQCARDRCSSYRARHRTPLVARPCAECGDFFMPKTRPDAFLCSGRCRARKRRRLARESVHGTS
jgi:HNH endonuclease